MGIISASIETLMDQAGGAGESYFTRAADVIDARCGAGAASTNPVAIGLVAVAMALDFHSVVLKGAIDNLTGQIGQLH